MKKQKGFTLVEFLIYLALFGLLFSGLFCGALVIVENIGRNDTQMMLAEEGAFLLAKIEQEKDISLFAENGGALEINGVSLNNSQTAVGDFKIEDLGAGLVKASFALSAKTGQGKIVSRDFSTIYFLPK